MNSLKNMEGLLSLNAFELFASPVKFDIDLHELNLKKNELQKTYHPDKWLDARDNHIVNNLSSHINSLYLELVNPISRAILILKLNNIDFDLKDAHVSSDLLMDQIEIREKLQENKKSFEKIHDIAHELEDKYYQIIKKLNDEFEAKNFEEVKILVTKLSYSSKLLIVVNEYIRDLI